MNFNWVIFKYSQNKYAFGRIYGSYILVKDTKGTLMYCVDNLNIDNDRSDYVIIPESAVLYKNESRENVIKMMSTISI